jgi:hypothetical protein
MTGRPARDRGDLLGQGLVLCVGPITLINDMFTLRRLPGERCDSRLGTKARAGFRRAQFRCSTFASELSLAQSVVTAQREEARDAVVALAAVRTANVGSRCTMRYDRDRICALLSTTRDELNIRFDKINSL